MPDPGRHLNLLIQTAHAARGQPDPFLRRSVLTAYKPCGSRPYCAACRLILNCR